MVISVDTGNKMIKTEHYEFNSGIDVLDTIPGENDEVIEFGGKYYRTTNRRISTWKTRQKMIAITFLH